MTHFRNKLIWALSVLALMVGVLLVVASLSKSILPDEREGRSYTDRALHFSLKAPSRATHIQKMGQAIYFGGSADGPWVIVVFAEPTPYTTTESWLASQPKGSASSRGYELIRWIGSQTDGKALVAEYAGPGEDSTYGKGLRMITVKNKSLYTVSMGTWQKADATLMVEPDIERALESFQATGLVTTDSNGSYRTIQNWPCNATFHIPPDWSDHGILGESKIVSPEDARENQEWADANLELLQNAEGEGPVGPDARSLYISCQSNIKMESVKSRALKKIQVNGMDAYEVADSGKMPDGTPFTNYSLYLEKGNVMEIHLGQTEYDNLPDTVKQIIQSISFEE